MPTRLSICWMVLLCACSWGQQAPRLTPEALLNRAYELSLNLPLEDRVALLSPLASGAAMRHLRSAEPWTADLFAVSKRLPPGVQREVLQCDALKAMARLNPEHALQLLGDLDQQMPADELNYFSPHRSEAVAAVFDAFLARHGNPAPLLSAARHLGDSGHYPYSALVPLLSRAQGDDADSLFKEASTYYSGSSISIVNEFDFMLLLRSPFSRVRHNLARDAAVEMAARLKRVAENPPSVASEYRIYTDKGLTVLDNPGERLIWQALPTLRTIDESVAESLGASRPALNQPTLAGAKVRTEMAFAKTENEAQRSMQVRGDAEIWMSGEARTKPKQAAKLGSAVTDPFVRVSTTAELAASTAPQDPIRAKALLKEAFGGVDEIEAVGQRLAAFGHVGRVAVRLSEKPVFEQCLKAAFELVPASIAAYQKAPAETRRLLASNGYRLTPLVRLGAYEAPQATVAKIDTVPDDATKAYLLIEVANNLGVPPRYHR
jgi:hypothetical protein